MRQHHNSMRSVHDCKVVAKLKLPDYSYASWQLFGTVHDCKVVAKLKQVYHAVPGAVEIQLSMTAKSWLN